MIFATRASPSRLGGDIVEQDDVAVGLEIAVDFALGGISPLNGEWFPL
jgi:hypothetical protein